MFGHNFKSSIIADIQKNIVTISRTCGGTRTGICIGTIATENGLYAVVIFCRNGVVYRKDVRREGDIMKHPKNSCFPPQSCNIDLRCLSFVKHHGAYKLKTTLGDVVGRATFTYDEIENIINEADRQQ